MAGVRKAVRVMSHSGRHGIDASDDLAFAAAAKGLYPAGVDEQQGSVLEKDCDLLGVAEADLVGLGVNLACYLGNGLLPAGGLDPDPHLGEASIVATGGGCWHSARAGASLYSQNTVKCSIGIVLV